MWKKESWATELANISRHTKLSSWRDWILSLLTKGEIRHVQSCCFAFCQAIAYLTFSSPPASQAPSKRTQHCWPTTPNTVGCYILCPFVHPVSCCWMLLRVVAQSLRPVKLVSQQLPTFFFFVPWSPKPTATMLDPFAQLFQHCWGHARSLRMDYKDLWVVFFPRCTAGPNIVGSCCIRLHTTANTHACNNSQHCWRKNVGSCCARFHASWDQSSTISI